MKRIIVLSDTHGNQRLLRKPFELETDYDMIMHLGDNYEDMQENFDLYEDAILLRVPGIFHPRYKDRSLQAIAHTDVDGWDIGLVHHLEDYFKQKHRADIVLHGHTHHSEIVGDGITVYANPGHLKSEYDRNREPSYMVIELTPKAALLTVRSLQGEVVQELRVER